MKRTGQIVRETMVDTIKAGVQNLDNTFLMSYTRFSSSQMGTLRKTLSKTGAKVYVARNRIAQKALKDLSQEGLSEKINGQIAFIWGSADAVEISKTLMDFVKGKENLQIQGGLLNGRLLNQDDVVRLSELPSREVLLSQLIGTLQSPITRFLGALNGKTQDLLSILKQLSEKKGGS